MKFGKFFWGLFFVGAWCVILGVGEFLGFTRLRGCVRVSVFVVFIGCVYGMGGLDVEGSRGCFRFSISFLF